MSVPSEMVRAVKAFVTGSRGPEAARGGVLLRNLGVPEGQRREYGRKMLASLADAGEDVDREYVRERMGTSAVRTTIEVIGTTQYFPAVMSREEALRTRQRIEARRVASRERAVRR